MILISIKMKKKIIFLSLFLFLAIIAAAAVAKYYARPKCDPDDQKGACAWRLIMVKKDGKICRTIADKAKRERCSGLINFLQKEETPQMTDCETVGGDYKLSCIATKAQKAAEAGSADACSGLAGSDQAACFNFYYLEEALKTRDARFCARISAEDRKRDCELAVSRSR